MSSCHCSSPSGLPTNCGALFSTLPESLRSLTDHLPAQLPILHSHENKTILMGTWWEQEEFDGNKRILMSYWWEQEELDENCLGTWWEQRDFDGKLMGTRGIWWELFGNLMGNQVPTLQKDRKHPLGACLHHPIGSPLQKLRNIPGGMLVPNDTSRWVGPHEQDKFFENILCHVMKYFLYIRFPRVSFVFL